MTDLAEKFRGALVGVAIGDALGAGFEGSASVEASDMTRREQSPGTLRYTDDTHMTLGIAESLVARNGFDGAHMARVFIEKFKEQPWRGYGPGPPEVFSLIQQGIPWDQAARALFGGKGSFGNGAAMRVAPSALFAYHDVDQVVTLARQTAVITHAHQLGIEGAVLQACAIARAVREAPSEGIDVRAFLEELRANATSPVYLQKLQTVGQLLTLDRRIRSQEVAVLLGNSIEAFRSVPTAIYAFLRNRESFPEVVRYAIGLGGDTDTIASMAGALAGAYLGLDAIPLAWRERVEGVVVLEDLADSLLASARRSR